MKNKNLSIVWSWIWRVMIFILLDVFVSLIVSTIINIFGVKSYYVNQLPVYIGVLGILIAIVVAFLQVRSKNISRFADMPLLPICVFRGLIALFVFLFIVVGLNFIFFHIGWDARAQDYSSWRILQPYPQWQRIIQAFSQIFIIINAFSLTGVFLFNKSARYWYVISFILYTFTAYIDYPYISSGLENALYSFAYILLGVTIALSFVSPVKEYFYKKGECK